LKHINQQNEDRDMKTKYKISVLVMLVCVLLCGCGKSDAVIKTEQQISAIGTVDETSLNKIEEAEELYSALTEKEKGKVENYQVLQTARDDYNKILVANLENLITTIEYTDGEPSEELKNLINKAKNDFYNLSEDLQATVTNYADLENVINAISKFYVQRAQNAMNLAMETENGYQEAEDLYMALSQEQKEQIINYEEFADSFENFKNKPPIELISYKMGKDAIGDPKFYLNAKNISDKTIKEFSVTVFFFDNDGIPVPVYFNDYSAGLSYSRAVKANETTLSNYYWTLYGSYNDMKQAVCIVKQVEFFDGTTWENPIFGKLSHKYNQQILSLDDENILARK